MGACQGLMASEMLAQTQQQDPNPHLIHHHQHHNYNNHKGQGKPLGCSPAKQQPQHSLATLSSSSITTTSNDTTCSSHHQTPPRHHQQQQRPSSCHNHHDSKNAGVAATEGRRRQCHHHAPANNKGGNGSSSSPAVCQKKKQQANSHNDQDSSSSNRKSPPPSPLVGMKNLSGRWGGWTIRKKLTFQSQYRVGIKLGEGAMAVVRVAIRKSDGQEVAVKIFDKKTLRPKEVDSMREEVEVLRYLDHPNIIRLEGFEEDRGNYYMLLELVKGGELLDRITKKTQYSEAEARDLFVTLVTAVQYMHDRGIVHRDLKPENLLLATDHDDAHVKIADFGFATRVGDGQEKSLTHKCGSPGYIAPEILRGDCYGKAVDMWSVGVITYILLGGYPPFYDKSQRRLCTKIMEGDYQFHPEIWDQVSHEAKDLISRLLTLSSEHRLTAAQALQHPWVQKDTALLRERSLGATVAELRRFNARRKFRATVRSVMAANKMAVMLARMRQEASKEATSPTAPASSSSSSSSSLSEEVEVVKQVTHDKEEAAPQETQQCAERCHHDRRERPPQPSSSSAQQQSPPPSSLLSPLPRWLSSSLSSSSYRKEGQLAS